MSDKTNDGGPAFPAPNFAVPRDMADEMVVKLRDMQGMTLRDYFAAKVMQGLLAHHGVYEEEATPFSLCSKEEARRRESSVPIGRVAEYAYITADAMLAARKVKS